MPPRSPVRREQRPIPLRGMARAWRERVNAPTPDPITHSWLDDAHALVAGSLFVALGMTMFAYAGLLTGGVAGIAFLISYASGISVALLFFGLSLPFFVLAWRRLGPAFTLKSFAAVALVSICTALAPKVVRFEFLDPWLASVLGGFLIGFGLLALLRHGASVGGVNIVAQWLQHSRGYSAGRVQMTVDVLVVLAALWVVPAERVLQSIAGAVAIGAILALNHRPGRYLGV